MFSMVKTAHMFLCGFSLLLLLASNVVHTSHICNKLSDIWKIGRGDVQLSWREDNSNFVPDCDLLPDYGDWSVSIDLKRFICFGPSLVFSNMHLCGTPLKFIGRSIKNPGRNPKFDIYKEAQAGETARFSYVRLLNNDLDSTLNTPSAPATTTNDIRCPSARVHPRQPGPGTYIEYSFEDTVTTSTLACEFKYKGLWEFYLDFTTDERPHCSMSHFIINDVTRVSGKHAGVSGYLREPHVKMFVQSGCFVRMLLQLLNNNTVSYNEERFKTTTKELITPTTPILHTEKATTTDGNTITCPPLFTKDVVSNRCYSRLSNKSLSFEEAKAWCQSQGGELPKVETFNDFKFFMERAPQTNDLYSYWLQHVGLYDTREYIQLKHYQYSAIYVPILTNGGYKNKEEIQLFPMLSFDKERKWHKFSSDLLNPETSYAICQEQTGKPKQEMTLTTKIRTLVSPSRLKTLRSTTEKAEDQINTEGSHLIIIISSVLCVVVVLLLAASVLIKVIRRHNRKVKMSLANVYENPNFQKSLAIETITGKNGKPFGKTFRQDASDDVQPILKHQEADFLDTSEFISELHA